MHLKPEQLNAYNISPEDAIAAVNRSSFIMPAGTDLLDMPIRLGNGPSVYLRDIGTVENGTDIVVGYAHVNGKGNVYTPVTKRSDASTLALIRRIRKALPRMKAAAPPGVDIRLEF